MRRILTFVLAVSSVGTTFACSKSRADVKQLKDAGAQQIPSESATSSVSALVAIARPSDVELKGAEHERLGSEKQLYRIVGTVAKAEFEPDGDVKLHLSDPVDASKVMLVEIPEPECVAPAYRAQVAQARSELKRLLKAGKDAHPVLTFTGVAFWGFVRSGDTAPNGIQLHPILKIEPR
jgi:hypothetical protein